MTIKRCTVTLTMEYDFVIEGDAEGIKEVLKTVVSNIEFHSMHRILGSYGELLNVAAIPIKAVVTPLEPGKEFTIDLKEGEALKD